MPADTFVEDLVRLILSYVIAPVILILTSIYDRVSVSNNRSNYNKSFKSESFLSPKAIEEAKRKHVMKVEDVQNQVRQWNKNGRKGQMCTARPTWQSISVHNINKDNFNQIKLDMNDIIEIDTEKRILTVEPGMTFGRLTSILIPMGWTIPVVPELELLTLGGCICGAGLETSSHKYGLVADACVSFELVLADGKKIVCTESENSDLFHCIPMSHGTLGFLTAVQIPLIPALKYVKIEYFPVNSMDAALSLLQKQHIDTEFVEGIVYSSNKAVIMFGNMVDEAEPEKINYINKWYAPWFYKHIENKFANSETPGGVYVEYISLRDYYHRHSRGYFWETPVIIPYGNSTLFRYLFGWIYPLNYQALKLSTPTYLLDLFWVKNHVLQDFVVPLDRLKKTLEFTHDLVQVYPIWLCPVVFLNKPGRGKPVDAPNEMYIDIGIYGITPKTKDFHPVTTTRKMEKFTIENKGFQGTYADVYMTREEFRQMFDISADYYDAIRVKYGATDAFPEIYDKISYKARRGQNIEVNN